MLAHRLDVADLEPGAVDQSDRLGERLHVHVGGDVRLDERPAARTVAGLVVAPRHLLDEHPAARPQVAVDRLGEHDVLLVADVLTHLDRGDRVDGPSVTPAPSRSRKWRRLTSTRSWRPRSAARFITKSRCSLDRVTPDDVDVVVLGRVQRERAPAGADVEHPHAGLETELAADEVELGALRLDERHLGRDVEAAGVRHGARRGSARRSRWRGRSGARWRLGRAPGCAARR